MYIEERDGRVSRIFPFVDDEKDTPFSMNISIYKDDKIICDGRLHTVEMVHQLIAAFQEALRAIEEEAP